MSTDRELLELAAKASGIDGEYKVLHYFDGDEVGIASVNHPIWNPLTDDGDALRLAVKLRMEVAIFSDECHARCFEHGQHEWIDEQGEPCAATRRAIVRAAAEIGRAK